MSTAPTFKVGDRVEWTEPDSHPSFVVRYRGVIAYDFTGLEGPFYIVMADERFCFHPEYPERGRELPFPRDHDRTYAVEPERLTLIQHKGEGNG